MKSVLALAGLAGLFFVSASRAEVVNCTPITALPATISVPGVYCLKQTLATSITSGNAITINTNNVIIDLNGFRLGGGSGGTGTDAVGIYAIDRQSITIRNGTIRGFRSNIRLTSAGDGLANSGHVIEDMRIEGARHVGIYVLGTRSTIRNNLVFDTGTSTIDTFAYGVFVSGGSGHTISGNSITGVAATNYSYGIYASTPVHIRGNDIRDLSGSSAYGIYSSGSGTLIQDNFIGNATTGSVGIYALGTTDACRDNAVSNFTTTLTGCSVSTGNTTY